MRATTILFSKNKAKLTNTKESQIKARLEELDRLICNNFNSPDIDNVLKEYENLKIELQSIYDQKGKASIFRSKCRWVEKGERPTKYFFNLEKRNHNKKTITELRIEDDSITYNDEKILEENSTENFNIHLNETTQLVLNKAKTSDFYKLLNACEDPYSLTYRS